MPKRGAAVFGLTLALVAMILPLAPMAASAQPAGAAAAKDPPTTAPTPPALPPPDATPPSNNPIPSVPAAPGEPATVLPPAPPSSTAGAPGQEIAERRTATSKTFVGDHPGEFRTEVYTAPIHFRDAHGHWADIKDNLGASKDGRRHNGANSFDLSVADSATDAALMGKCRSTSPSGTA